MYMCRLICFFTVIQTLRSSSATTSIVTDAFFLGFLKMGPVQRRKTFCNFRVNSIFDSLQGIFQGIDHQPSPLSLWLSSLAVKTGLRIKLCHNQLNNSGFSLLFAVAVVSQGTGRVNGSLHETLLCVSCRQNNYKENEAMN